MLSLPDWNDGRESSARADAGKAWDCYGVTASALTEKKYPDFSFPFILISVSLSPCH